MKRIVSLIMCLTLVFSACVFTACSDTTIQDLHVAAGTVETTSSNAPMTITIYGITDESTTPEAIEKVEEELNKISVRKYNTQVDLILYPEEVYAAQVFAKVKMAVNSFNTTRLEKAKDEDEKNFYKESNVNYIDYVGLTEATNLPSDLVTAPLDIFLVYTPDEDSVVFDEKSEYYNPILADGGMFNVLYSERALEPLNAKIKNGTYSPLRTSAYTQALSFVTRPQYRNENATDVYGIPNNYVYGSYDFVIMNREIVDLVYSGADKSDLAKSPDAMSAAVRELTAMKDELNVTYIEKTFASYAEYQAFADTQETFAFGYITGEGSIQNLFESNYRYDAYVAKKNGITPGRACDSMFCISPSTQNLERSLDILLLLQTNEDFRNIFQYGVEGTHYQIGHDGNVTLTGGTDAEAKYLMDPKWCGNMFILTPSDGMTKEVQMLAENNWKLARQQVKEILG